MSWKSPCKRFLREADPSLENKELIMQKLNFQRRAAARCAELFEMCPPKVSVGLRGGYGTRHENILARISGFRQLRRKNQMKKIRFSLIYVLTFMGVVLSASLVTADDRRNDGDRRTDNVTVSFGLWDPNKSDLMGAPLDRLVGDPPMGVGVADILIPQKVTIKEGDTVNFIIGGG